MDGIHPAVSLNATGRKMEHQGKRDKKAEDAKEIAHEAVKHLGLARNEKQEQRARERREENYAEEMI